MTITANIKFKLLSLALLFNILSATAQDIEIDKIKIQISNHPQQDTFRVNRLNELGRSFGLVSNLREDAANEAVMISRKINYAEGEGYALANLGEAYTSLGNKLKATIVLQQADSIAKKTGNQNLLSLTLTRMASNAQAVDNKKALSYGLQAETLALQTGNKAFLFSAQRIIGRIYHISLTDYPNAMKYFLKALASAEATGRLENLAVSWSDLATLYSAIGDQKSALLYYEKAVNANKKLGNKSLARNILTNIGEGYRLMGNYPEAIKNYKESLDGETNANASAINESNLADVYTRLDSLPLAFKYAFSSLAISKEQDDRETESWIYGILSRAYLKKQMVDSAIYYGQQGLAAAKEVGTVEYLRDNTFALANAYAYKKDYQNAYLNHLQYITYRDSMLNSEITNKTSILQYNYDLSKKEVQITELKQQKKGQRNFLISALIVLGLIIISVIVLLRSNRIKQKANTLLRKQKKEIEYQRDQTNKVLTELKQTQTQLIQSEKMASLGELTAGIAHEIQNPLNFVNNFSEVSNEMIQEIKEERAKNKEERDEALQDEILEDISKNLEKISHHGKRADAIVKGMLQHSRSSSGTKEPTDINALADEYLRLSYHGLRAKDKSFNAHFETNLDESIGKINIVPQDMGRVIMNLVTNAFYAVNERKQNTPQPPEGGVQYEPKVTISTKSIKSPLGDLGVIISVSDNGNGIPASVQEKIFQPFFTTKPTGKGTGLGLSLSYDIIKAHSGEILVESVQGEGTQFTIQLPVI
jgi:two-component system NtrC family sensor kinase